MTAVPLPKDIPELVDKLNTIPEYNSPPAGALNVGANQTPYNSLGQGTRLLISLADSIHDLKKVARIKGLVQTGPGQLTLKAWCKNLVNRLPLPPSGGQTGLSAVFVDKMIDIIYNDPEYFVNYYLYYNDMFYYTNYQYISESLPLTAQLAQGASAIAAEKVNNRKNQQVRPYHFLLLNYPPHGTSGKNQQPPDQVKSVTAGANYSKLSASILYKIY